MTRSLFLAIVMVASLVGSCAHHNASPVCLSGAYLDDDGFCRAQRAPIHHLPFRSGYKTRVVQGFHGYPTHKGDHAYSLDLHCEVGDPIVASRSGKVFALREDSRVGCADRTCIDDANYVVIDHGDGTFSEYHHLQNYGVLVDEGDDVCMGQVIGICGATGYTGGPHLHFALFDVTHHTAPVQFIEGVNQSGLGFLSPQTTFTSENERLAQCKTIEHSRLQRDAFAHQGIILDEGLPLVVDDRSREWTVQGTYHGGYPSVSVHRRSSDDGPWIDECVPVDQDGRFRIPVVWSAQDFAAGTHWLMVTGSDDACLSRGWAWSYRIQIRDGT